MFIFTLVIQKNYALPDIQDTIISKSAMSAMNFDPLQITVSLVLNQYDTITAKDNSDITQKNSVKYISTSSVSANTVRTNFGYYHGFKFPNA